MRKAASNKSKGEQPGSAVRLAGRMQQLAPYLFAELDRKKKEALAKGVDVISLTIGDPDLPTPGAIVEAGQKALADPANHRYPPYAGSPTFKAAAAAWLKKRFGVVLDPEKEILALVGTKEGIFHLPFALVDPGEVVLVPDPGYPVYAIATRLAGGEVHWMPLREQNGFLPDLEAIPAAVARKARMLWVNYPNNPTAAVADLAFFEGAVAFCRENGCVLCVDSAYSEVAFDGYRAPSALQVPGGKEVAVEFHSFSKTYNMCGWRVGFAAGCPEVVSALGRLKNNLDSGVFQAVQVAAVAAMALWPSHLPEVVDVYRRRRDVLVEGLRRAGLNPPNPKATFYVWMPVPGGDDQAFANALIEKAGVLVAPGSGFGPSGKGYVRFALTVGEERLREAARRIQQAKLGG
jgi:LL-diaminopimelate aminotransferase